ncbi:MAG: hypothetical protein B7Y80_09430 [Hyphomicrobium sp. 32-62-53]|nr:MAG: hypothetical protein B7Z29_09290 [Hyphomicrobium sp. 12-62-95]OYX99801.1 MAG: hypothetical protein B7Y80_09430 [Hyphomicrobium sp. 32-62-53]
MTELPNGWISTSLGAVVDYGRTEKVEPCDIRPDEWVLELEDIEKDTSTLLQKRLFSDRNPKSTKNRFAAGDILYGKLRPNLNKVILATQPGVCSTEILPLRCPEGVEPQFVFYALKRAEFLDYVTQVNHGNDMPRLGTEAGRAAALPLAPTDEQRRIVAKLDSLRTRSSRARYELDRIPKLIERYKKAFLRAALSGDVTAAKEERTTARPDVEYDLTIRAPVSWKRLAIADICNIVGGSQPSKSTFCNQCKPGYVRLIQIRDYKSDKHLTYIPRSLARRFCEKNDIMIGRYGPPIFQILRGLEGAYNVALMKAEPNTEVVHREFLYWLLQSPDLLTYVEVESKRTAGQDGVNKSHLLKFPVFLPEKNEQLRILYKIKHAMAWLDRITSEHTRANALLTKLDQAILARAFRGELVPQDPNDEPASTLLERIAASRTTTPAKNRKQQRGEL